MNAIIAALTRYARLRLARWLLRVIDRLAPKPLTDNNVNIEGSAPVYVGPWGRSDGN